METTTQATSATEWKKRSQAVPFTVPSGNTCLIRPKSLNAYIKEGRLPDTAMKMAQRTMQTGRAPTEEEIIAEAENDLQLIPNLMELMDQIVVECVVEPKVLPVPDTCAICHVPAKDHASKNPDHDYVEEERHDDLLYVDDVDFNDKAAIMAFVTGGIRDLKSFRNQPEGDVETVQDGGGVPLPTVIPPRADS